MAINHTRNANKGPVAAKPQLLPKRHISWNRLSVALVNKGQAILGTITSTSNEQAQASDFRFY